MLLQETVRIKHFLAWDGWKVPCQKVAVTDAVVVHQLVIGRKLSINITGRSPKCTQGVHVVVEHCHCVWRVTGDQGIERN
jgi:hypothetical protein